VGLVDFGMVGRLSRRVQSAIANMFVAMAEEDFDRMAYIYVDLAPFHEGVDVDGFARDIRSLLGPYVGLTLAHVNMGRILMRSCAIATDHGLVLPAELVLFFKSIASVEGMGRLIADDFDFLTESIAFAKEQLQSGPDTKRLLYDASFFARDMQSLLHAMPRQTRFMLRRLNDPNFTLQVRSRDTESLRRTVEKGFSQIFWGLIFAAIIVGMLLHYKG
jgi:ubiquinone biosynthesis protein